MKKINRNAIFRNMWNRILREEKAEK
jgi:hypothetical protein